MTKCKCCGDEFKEPEWCFYDLCDPCFRKFDLQKMAGRFRALDDTKLNPFMKIHPEKYGYFEDAEKWMKAQGKCKCKE